MTATTVYGANAGLKNTSPVTPTGPHDNTLQKVQVDYWAGATTSIDEVDDTILLCPVKSNAIPLSLEILNGDMDTHSTPTLAVDVGVYYAGGGQQALNGKAAGDVIDADLFASAITSLDTARTVPLDITHESGVIGFDEYKEELWELAGLSADPGGDFYIGFRVTATAATAAAAKLKVIFKYL